MTPRFIRAVLMVLAVRAIFISPSVGSEFGTPSRLGDSSLKRIDPIRPARLRFTKPCPTFPSQERIDCLGDGDDDERTSLGHPSLAAWDWVISPREPLGPRPSIAASSARSLVRLRC